ncbi:MAG: hypothetical protein ABSF90_21370 [Syntrophobacteraceae bacterium]|jgi:hypothetical protein
MRDRAGPTLSLILEAAYTICRGTSGQIPDLAEAIRLLFACPGIVAGIKLLVILASARLVEIADGDRIYLFIGGFATVWVFVQAIIKSFYDTLPH